MSETDNRLRPKLPVTAEVGGEGGSYSDPTHQVASFEGDVARTEVALPTVSAETAGADPNHGMVRYPTEPPAPPSATEGRRMSGLDWRAGAIGAVAGAAAVLGARWMRNRRDL